jgi:hypothetical protein
MDVSRIGRHQVNPQWQAKTEKGLKEVVAKSIEMQGNEPRKNVYSEKIPNRQEATKVNQAAARLLLSAGKPKSIS